MSKNLHLDVYSWCIYAVISRKEEIAFISKSKAKNPKARFREHIRGENEWTADDFGPNGIVKDAEFIVLESIECCTSIAYRHTVAWGHFFEEHKFDVLSSLTKSQQFDNLQPKTQEIYDQVCAPFLLSEVLDREVTYEWRAPEPRKGLPSKKANKDQMTQLNLRVARGVAKSFRDLCKQRRLSQNNMLALLLAPENQSRAVALNAPWEELNDQKNANALVKKENEMLRKNAASARDKERRYRHVLVATGNTVIELLNKYCAYFVETPDLPTVTLKHFKQAKKAGVFRDYQYPQEDGVAIITLEHVVEGKRNASPYTGHLMAPALFVCGETEDGDKVRFRWYPKKDGLGISPRDSAFTYLGAKWLVGYMLAQDGAMDMIAIVPLDLFPEETLQPDADTREAAPLSLEEQVQGARMLNDYSYF